MLQATYLRAEQKSESSRRWMAFDREAGTGQAFERKAQWQAAEFNYPRMRRKQLRRLLQRVLP